MSKTIIGIVGFIGSGKGTLSDYLVDNHGYKTESFAKPVKDAVSYIFGWERSLLEGDTKESREFREQIDNWWADKLEMPNLTPRLILQYFGTDLCRNNFHSDIWLMSLEKRLLNSTKNVVISDCRFYNEIDMIKRMGGTIIRTKRGVDPEWFDNAKIFNKGPDNNPLWEDSKNCIYESGVHSSEYSWIGGQVDYVLENDTTIRDFHEKIEQILIKI